MLLTGRQKKFILVAAIGVWAIVVAAGSCVMISYGNSPGVAANPQHYWPVDSGIRRAVDKATLVMLAHPKCQCTRASLGELALLMARLPARLESYVLFYEPEPAPAGWKQTDLWDKAAAIPGVAPSWDRDGSEARRFGAATSGRVLVYDASGKLVFSGGITGSRGDSGDNRGRSAIVSLLTGDAGPPTAFVFGCSLLDTRVAGKDLARD